MKAEDRADEPLVAARSPVVVKLAAGTYYWCRCGRSSHQPFCDGSHRGTGLEPLKWRLEEDRRVALCACKKTGDAPLCDGSHARLSGADEGPVARD